VVVRVVTDAQPEAQARPVPPHLEDAYLYSISNDRHEGRNEVDDEYTI
jgi:hypothetical protein